MIRFFRRFKKRSDNNSSAFEPEQFIMFGDNKMAEVSRMMRAAEKEFEEKNVKEEQPK